jgi:integrase
MDLVEKFFNEYMTLNSITDSRRATFQRAFDLYITFLDTKSIVNADDNDLRSWQVDMLATFKPTSVALYMKAMKVFFKWLWQQRAIDGDQYMRIQVVAPPRGSTAPGKPRPYTLKEIQVLLAEIDRRFPLVAPEREARMYRRIERGTSSSHARRASDIRRHMHRRQLDVIVNLALVCGMRRGEMYGLTVDDLHPDNAYITVHGKREDYNPKVRRVPYSDSTREVVAQWFRVRRLLGVTYPRVWVCLYGIDYTAEMQEERFGKSVAALGEWELHRLRHTSASERLRAGMKLEELSKLLGHASITQTLGYADITPADVQKAFNTSEKAFQKAVAPPPKEEAA